MSGIVWVEEPNENSFLGKRKKRQVGKRKIEFVGWGSKPLIEFIEAVGKDVTTKLTQNEVAALIIKYINDNNLFCPQRKKKFECDNRLHAIFAKKVMFRTKVYEMLEEHFAENHDESEDELTDSSDEENCLEKKRNVKLKTIPLKPKSCFAAVVPDNIKLVYLKKSLVQEFLNVPESFDSKIVGSFVRMSSDPFDIYQKNRFQLQLVTGVEKVSEASSAGTEVRLKVANYFKDIPISTLSDENFTDEEIEDVRDRIKAGALQRLTVVALESKAQMLHSDITKHWIARELILLKRRIERANEKGWRRELYEYLDRRKLLQTPSEVEKLLHKIPEVIAEELEPDASVMTAMACANSEGNGCSPTSILRVTSDVSSTDALGFGDLATASQTVADDLPTPRRGNIEMDNGAILTENPGFGDLATPSRVVADFSVGISTGQTGDAIPTRNPCELIRQAYGGPLTGPPPGMDEPTGGRNLGHPPGINVNPPRIGAYDNMEIPIPGSTSTKAMHITEEVYKKDRRVFIRRMLGKICFDPSVANTDISALLRHHFAGEGCWKETSMTTRDAVWYDFGMRYRWNEEDNMTISRLFCQVAAKCYERMIYEAHRRWTKKGKKKIGWMQEKYFRYLVKYRWDTPEFKKVSEKNRTNRGTDPTYCGGRKPMSAYQRELDDAAGIEKDENEPTRTSLGVLIGSKKKGFKKHHEVVKDAIKIKTGRSGERSSGLGGEEQFEEHEGPIQYQVGSTQLTLGEEMQYWSQPEGFIYQGQADEYNRLMDEKYPNGRPDAGDPWMGVETAVWKAAGHNCRHGRIYGFGGNVNPRDFPGYSGSYSVYQGSQLRQTNAVEREHAAFVNQFSARAPIDRFRDVDPHFDDHVRGAYHGESSRYETGGSSRRSDTEREEDYDDDEEDDDDEDEEE